MPGHFKQQQFHGKKKMTRDQTRTRLLMQLYSSTDEAFRKYTVPELQRSYGNLPVKELARELEEARVKRGLNDDLY